MLGLYDDIPNDRVKSKSHLLEWYYTISCHCYEANRFYVVFNGVLLYVMLKESMQFILSDGLVLWMSCRKKWNSFCFMDNYVISWMKPKIRHILQIIFMSCNGIYFMLNG